MNNKNKIWLLIFGTIVFTLIFWKQSIGLNAFIFSVFVIVSLILSFPESIKSRNALILYIGLFISSLSIVFHASGLAIFVWIISLFFVQPIVQNTKVKTLFFAGFTGLIDYFTSFTLIKQNTNENSKSSIRTKKIFKIIRLIVIPIIVVYVFYWIYKAAVPEFDKITDSIFGRLGEWFSKFFKDISFEIVFMILWGFVTTAWYLYKQNNNLIIKEEEKLNEDVQRKRGKEFFQLSNTKSLKPLLKYENSIALILILSVNFLLLTVNILDISTIWFGFKYTPEFNLKQFVHEGTYLLILSILLSMGIMLFFFRANLNFYSKNKYVKYSAYFWIFQNTILLISVIIRNLHYIEHFALAYLRIGLFFFLSMVIVGLITLSIKIYNNKSLFYLLKVNTWALYIGFVIFAVFDWDVIIAKYNLRHYSKSFVEASYMLTLDEKTFPLLDKHTELLEQSDTLNTYRYFSNDYKTEYNDKVSKFLTKNKEKSWLSWNYADYKAVMYFKK